MAKNKKQSDSNPFAALKKIVLEEKGTSSFTEVGKKTVKKKPTSCIKTPAKGALTEEDDASLFLSAMQSVAPSSQKDVYTSSSDAKTMHDVFADLGKKEDQSKKIKKDTVQTETVENVNQTIQKVMAEEPSKLEEANLFVNAMNDVVPVKGKGRDLVKPPEKPSAKALAPVDVMQQLLDGNIEFALHNTGEYIEGHVVGVDPMVIEQLRAGTLSPEAHVDLHGQNAEQAYETLSHFLKHAYQKNMRTVIVVTGRGKNSPSGIGIIRSMLPLWLTRNPFKRVVLGFCSARPHDGGAGAAYVLLRKYKKSRGKIIWDMPYGGSVDSLM